MGEVHIVELGHDAVQAEFHHRPQRIPDAPDQKEGPVGVRILSRSIRVGRLLAWSVPARLGRISRGRRRPDWLVSLQVVLLFSGPGVDLLVAQPLSPRLGIRAAGFVQPGQDGQSAANLGGDDLARPVGERQSIVGGREEHAVETTIMRRRVFWHGGRSLV